MKDYDKPCFSNDKVVTGKRTYGILYEEVELVPISKCVGGVICFKNIMTILLKENNTLPDPF